jgi:hypothetical protein
MWHVNTPENPYFWLAVYKSVDKVRITPGINPGKSLRKIPLTLPRISLL